MRIFNFKSKLSNISFLIIPIVFAFLVLSLKSAVSYSLFSVDPDIPYIFNGLNILVGNLPYHIDNPGTPVQIISAAVIFIVHLFRGESSLIADVMQNPDLYTSAVSNTLIGITMLVIYFSGFYVFRITNSLLSGIIIQLAPFASALYLSVCFHVAPDILEGAISMIFFVALLRYIYNRNTLTIGFDKYSIWFSVIIGFGCSVKLIFAPIIIIPLLILNGWKNRIVLILGSLASFFIFAFPIIGRWNYFNKWINQLFMHSGIDGGGPANIVNWESFFYNIKQILNILEFYFQSLLILLLALLIYKIPIIKRKIQNNILYKALVGLMMFNLLLIPLVSKHFRFSYLIPAYLLIIPGLFLIFELFKPTFKNKSNEIKLSLFLLLVVLLGNFEIRPYLNSIHNLKQLQANYLQTKKAIDEKYRNFPVLILPNYYGSPYPEYSVFFGKAWSGHKSGVKFETVFREIYSNSYIFSDYNRKFNSLTKTFEYSDLLVKYDTMLVFSANSNLEKLVNPFIKSFNLQSTYKFSLEFENEITQERIYKIAKISSDTLLMSIVCDAETKDTSGLYFETNKKVQFLGAQFQSSEQSRTGKYSCKLMYNQTRFETYLLGSDQKETYKITVWQYDNANTDVGFAIKDWSNNIICDTLKTAVVEKSGNWICLETEVCLPFSNENRNIGLCCINKNDKIAAYFDDFSIERINP